MPSDTSTTSISYCQETSFGVLPAASAFKLLRLTGESIQHQKATIQSNEIRSDRQVSDLVKVGGGASGAVNIEFSTEEYKTLILAAMGRGSWSELEFIEDMSVTGQVMTLDTFPPGFVGAGYIDVQGFTDPANNGVKRILSSDSTAKTITFEAGSFNSDEGLNTRTLGRRYVTNGLESPSFAIERGVMIDGGATAYQHHSGMTVAGWALKITSMEMITGSFSFMGKIGAYANRSQARAGESAATGTLTLSGNAVLNETVTIGVGTGQKVYTWKASPTTVANEVEIGGNAQESILNLVAAITGGAGSGTVYGNLTQPHTQVTAASGPGDTMVLTALLTDATGFFGNTILTTETMTAGSFASATLTGGVSDNAHTAVTTEEVLNGTNNVVTIASGAAALSDPAKSLSFAINNNNRTKHKIGTEGAFEIGQGQFSVTGSLECYFEDNTLFEKIVDHDDVSLSLLLQDSDGNAIGLTWPRVKLADGNPNAGGNNADIMINPNFTAIKDPVTGCTMIVDVFPTT